MANVAGGGGGSRKTPRETWHCTYLDSGNETDQDIVFHFPADSANIKDVNTIGFKNSVDAIKGEWNVLSDSQEFSDVGNVSIMIDNKNIVETCIEDLIADIQNDVTKLNVELNDAYEDVVKYHNKQQLKHNKVAEKKARSNCNSGKPWVFLDDE